MEARMVAQSDSAKKVEADLHRCVQEQSDSAMKTKADLLQRLEDQERRHELEVQLLQTPKEEVLLEMPVEKLNMTETPEGRGNCGTSLRGRGSGRVGARAGRGSRGMGPAIVSAVAAGTPVAAGVNAHFEGLERRSGDIKGGVLLKSSNSGKDDGRRTSHGQRRRLQPSPELRSMPEEKSKQWAPSTKTAKTPGGGAWLSFGSGPVSYTHLTLPTICSV